jgi:tetratricopeptide (TPR) repeat protein
MSDPLFPAAPASETGPVKAWSAGVVIPTYRPGSPEPLPMFFERRSYQGADGRVYPLAYCDQVERTKSDQVWKAVYLENEHLRVMLLPEIGGRLHLAIDKSNGYDIVYRQTVIKPAMVGLAGLWASGGIEFNWPQHHRPSTFMPTDVFIESHDDGSRTVWMSEHEPMGRMKGMHGVCLRPGSNLIELKVRLYNRTPFTQTFLWWANVATRVHEQYQSFFPPDVYYVLDHSRRGISAFPMADRVYYGIDFAARGRDGVRPSPESTPFVPPEGMYQANDLSWYANIPVPMSYMCTETKDDFFGGYDHAAQAGIVHVADHQISPGKKQWTWGNNAFGHAWDRNLTDEGGPYIELMAGVFTDNQPDFSFLAPGETRTFRQFWYPIRKIGPAQKANEHAALSMTTQGRTVRLGLCVTRAMPDATIRLSVRGKAVSQWTQSLNPDDAFTRDWTLEPGTESHDVRAELLDHTGGVVIAYQPTVLIQRDVPEDAVASEPVDPSEVESVDELYHIGIHLEQYRQPYRSPEDYWREALRRDPLHVQCNTALARWYHHKGRFDEATGFARRSIERLTRRNSNPRDGEPHYTLGLCLGALGKRAEARDAFFKSTWNLAWQSPAYLAIAKDDIASGEFALAIEHLDRVLAVDSDNLAARNLKAYALRKVGKFEAADTLLDQTLRLDGLDWWASHLRGRTLTCDTQTSIDVALDYASAGLAEEALSVLDEATPAARDGSLAIAHYLRADLYRQVGETAKAAQAHAAAKQVCPDYGFPSRLQEYAVLTRAMDADPTDARAPYYLGNFLYDRRRHEQAIESWERSARLDSSYYGVWRNLAVAYFNIRRDVARSVAAMERSFRLRPGDPRLLHGRDQLARRAGESPAERLARLETHRSVISDRDDLTLEYCSLLNQLGRFSESIALMRGRRFVPWEGGEGLTTNAWVRAQLGLGRSHLRRGDAREALGCFESALDLPATLGEDRHALTSLSDVRYWIGRAYDQLGDGDAALREWELAAEWTGDFQDKGICTYTERTYHAVLANRRLDRESVARDLTGKLRAHVQGLQSSRAKPVYFTTSLPGIMFQDDLQTVQEQRVLLLEAMLARLEGRHDQTVAHLQSILKLDPGHPLARSFAQEIELD